MAPATISNSAGPGSATELSPLTIAVRDKVIEKFSDQPLEAMNEAVKKLLNQEKDEQKRLGILAARVYILRQRIVSLSETGNELVVGSKSPTADNTVAPESNPEAGDEIAVREWTRIRILEDCEVNGVRFPQSVIVDVKTPDADRLVENGKAEVIDETPPTEESDLGNSDSGNSDLGNEADSGLDNDIPSPPEADALPTTVEAASESAAVPEDMTADVDASLAAEPEDEGSSATSEPSSDQADVADSRGVDTDAVAPSEQDAVIEAPSAEEVTAALEALSSGPGPQETVAPDTHSAPESGASEQEDEAAAVFASLEATSEAMGTDPVAATEADDKKPAKKGGWLEAQQSAESEAGMTEKKND